MLDVHILVSRDTRPEWVTQCLDSVREAIAAASFPVLLHQVDGVSGHIGAGRAAGYALGNQPYVTYVDDDDYVQPHAFAQMVGGLRAGVSAVCTPEETLQNGCLRPGAERHHLIAYRRDLLIDHAAWTCYGDIAQMKAMGPDAVDLPRSAYVHRLYMTSKARVLRRANLAERERVHG